MNDQNSRQERLAQNQVLFREVNARVEALNEAFDDILDTHLYACECAELACLEQVELTPSEYTAIRRNPRRFFVAAGEQHVFPNVEAIVEKSDRYWVVEKSGTAGEIAAEQAASGS
jgi:5-bromo-4-chloroindolyl phosphate hydrolysis protein